ncbi:MAG: hypothetical protein OXR67_01965 [Chloroflexota bacterium]|nr:hypothetical protein [Chloroflexota bacterium]
MDPGPTIFRPIAFVVAAILLAGAILSCGSESDPDPTPDVPATIDAAVKPVTPTEAPTIEPTATVRATITASQPGPETEGSTGPVFWELDSASTGRDFAALLTSDETTCLETRLGEDYQIFLDAPLTGGAGDLLAGDDGALAPLESCLSGNRLAAARVSVLSIAAGGFSVETQHCMVELLETDSALTQALAQPGDVASEPTALRLISCLTTQEAAKLTPAGEGRAPNPDETACLIGELEGTPYGERIIAVLSGADATGEGLTMEESAVLGEAVRACDIETEFGFPKPEGAESQGLRPDGLSPVELGDPQQFFAELSARERTCLGDNGIGPGELGALSDPPPGGSPQVTAAVVNCLQDDTVLRLFLTQLVGQVEPFEMETAACIREGFVPLDLRALLAPSVAGQAPANSLALSIAALAVSVSCLSDAEWETYAPRLGMAPGDRAGFVCLLEALGGPAALVAAMQSASLGEAPAKFIRASQTCGLEDSGPSGQGGAGQSRQGQRVLIDPGPGTTHIDPYLWGLLQRQAEGLPVPDRVTVSIGSYTEFDIKPSLEEFIASLGGEQVAPHTWDLPTGQVLAVVQRPDVFEVEIDPAPVSEEPSINTLPYDSLRLVVAAFAYGVPAESAAQYAMIIKDDSVVVGMNAPDAGTISSIRAWLNTKNVYVVPTSEDSGVAPNHLAVLLPVRYIKELADSFPEVHLSSANHRGQGLTLSRAYWPQETRDLEDRIVAQYLPD